MAERFTAMAISEDEVRKVAKLARLELSDEQVHRFAGQLGAMLDYVDRLKELDVEGVEPMAHAISLRNVFRPDEARESQGVEATLANSPASDPPYFKVPRVLGG